MSYNFDDDDLPFDANEINKIFKQLQHTIMKALEEQGIDLSTFDFSKIANFSNVDLSSFPGLGNFTKMSAEELQDMMENNPNIKKMGFSISIDPSGKPNIQPLGGVNLPFSQGRSNQSGFDEPFVDTFYSEHSKSYQIIAEIQGVEHRDHVHIRVKDNDLLIHAETGPFKYRKSMLLKHPIDVETLQYTLNNGVLEITAKSL